MTYKTPMFSKGTTTYKDFDISFKYNPSTGDLRTVTDNNSIKQSIKNIIFTLYGDRPFDPNFGAGIHSMLFEPLDQITKIEIENRLFESLLYYEPRIDISRVSVSSGVDDNSVSITIAYSIKNQATPQSLNVVLSRIR